MSPTLHASPTKEMAVATTTKLEVDGSVMEGGGQILRNAFVLACLLNKPIHISKIRAGRSSPGLRPQHLTGIQLIAEICRGKLEGDYIGSTEVTFDPGPIQGGDYSADTQTAGSICLLLQVALPCLLFAKERSNLILRGGTNVDMAPPIDYTIKVFQPLIERMGVHFNCTVQRKGFFPKGRGEVLIIPDPVVSLHPILLVDRGNINEVQITSFTAGVLPPKIAHDMGVSAKTLLSRQLPDGVPVTMETTHLKNQEAYGNGSGIMLVAKTTTGCIFGGSCNGSKNESAEKSGQKAADEIIQSIKHGGCVDSHMQDQLVIFMALAKGHSKVLVGPLTLHTQTAIHVVELMTKVRFNITKVDDKTHIIECDGMGMEI